MKIEALYPELCHLHGDAMHIKYLSLCLPDAEIVRTKLRDEPAFVSGEADLVYLGMMTESSQEAAIDALTPHRDAIARRIDGGGAFLVTGNASELFGKYIENEDGTRIDALGLFDVYAKRRRPSRANSLYLGKFGGMDIVGFNSRFTYMYGDAEPMFRTVRGLGRNPDTMDEGLRRNNFMATHLIGPLLVLNPPFTLWLLGLLGGSGAALPYPDAAYSAYNKRLSDFNDAKRNFIYSK